MTPIPASAWIGAIAFFSISSGLLGNHIGGLQAGAELARVREAGARDQATIAEHNSRRLLDAQTRSDQLTRQLAAANQAAADAQEKFDVAIRRATTGRRCLSAPALRVLNGTNSIRIDLPEALRGTAAEDGAFATDTGIGLWIGAAGRQYDECRRRLDALIDWHEHGSGAQ